VSHRVIEVARRKYVYAPEDPVPKCSRLCGLIQARVVNKVTGSAVIGNIMLKSDIPSAFSEVKGDGMAGLVGVPREVFPEIAMKNYKVKLDICAQGYKADSSIWTFTCVQCAISGTAAITGKTVMILNDVSKLIVGEDLLVGPPGPTMRMVKLVALDPVLKSVTISPGLSFDYNDGDPVVPVVSLAFKPLYLGDIKLDPEKS
jgi:hypothetical protein